ncbi:MAG: hypothetical protein S4CHLAM2_05730 [Chlamydiales bacterium]|nr:hypothetical protein [Chlamydiales bacterium]
MRSRYSAYALGNADYIMRTTHSEHPDKQLAPSEWKEQIKAFCQATQFTGLEILQAEGDTVTFRAGLQQGGKDVSFTEKSAFGKEGAFWRYKARL